MFSNSCNLRLSKPTADTLVPLADEFLRHRLTNANLKSEMQRPGRIEETGEFPAGEPSHVTHAAFATSSDFGGRPSLRTRPESVYRLLHGQARVQHRLRVW